MSDRILQAFMQLFAIVANTDEVGQNGRALVERFLRWQLPRQLVEHYLKVYDQFLFQLKERVEEGRVRKRTSVNSVKVLRICSEINKELEQRQKIIVLIRLYEFIHNADGVFSTQHLEFLNTVADVFSIPEVDRDHCRAIATGAAAEGRIMGGQAASSPDSRTNGHGLPEGLQVLTFDDPRLMVIRYKGNDPLTLDGREVLPGVVMVCEPGSVIRGPRFSPVYYNDIISSQRGSTHQVVYEARKLGYRFPGGNTGLHPLDFTARSGQLIGIMGNSGAGKTTLLNLLNGSLMPSEGGIRINGESQGSSRTSTIGNVPQDDLLIEELTVFQNLYFSSKLYFGALGEEELVRKVDTCLEQLQLSGVRDLKVGDPLNKFISGGQRKRLNIALELIREPEVLFVDEPTSGLSSSDSENVMDLLKQQALFGKLVFVVIHQPSSEIYKLFDELLVLDTGGYTAYFGNPVDALGYFRRQMNHVNHEYSECPECGTINPEELFTIINARTVDEFGKPTPVRKMAPEEWYRLFLQNRSGDEAAAGSAPSVNGAPRPHRVSGKGQQFLVYFKRNLLAKLQNVQYMSITLLEAPLLAFILAFTLRSSGGDGMYLFGNNTNIPAYLFISTIVALFLGLITSAEEIIQDRKILRREAYLNLSRQSYLISKISYLFVVSAVQSALFVFIGNPILGFTGGYLSAFLMLFSVSCLGNLLGLNISSALRTRVAVYILIPFLVIPQIMFSGVLVRFDELNPAVSSPAKVPLVGNLMATRWAFEALAADQFSGNSYEKHFFKNDQALNNVLYRKDSWMPLMQEQLANTGQAPASKRILAREFSRFNAEFPDAVVPFPEACREKTFNAAQFRTNLDTLKAYLLDRYGLLAERKEQITEALLAREGGADGLKLLKLQHRNEQLSDLVLNTTGFKAKAFLSDEGIVRRFRPVYSDARSTSMLEAPFYAAEKSVFGMRISSLSANLMAIWFMALVLYLMLYFDILGRMLEKRLFRSSPA